MSEAKKKALEAFEGAADKMTEADLNYITGYCDCAANNARDSSEAKEVAEDAEN